jgi:Endonuclease/Exonuclease/phosphatase family.
VALGLVTSDIDKYRMDLVGVHKVRWEGSGTLESGYYTLFYWEGNANHQLGTGYFLHRPIRSVDKKVEFIGDCVSCITLKGRWCDIIVLNVHAPSEDKKDDIKESFYEEIEQLFDQLPMYHMEILLGDFNTKVGQENIFQPTIGTESVHPKSNDNGTRLVNFATSKNLIVKSIKFPHHNIHKYTSTSPDGITHNQTDHVLVDKRRQSSIIDVRSLRGDDCDTDHYLVVATI